MTQVEGILAKHEADMMALRHEIERLKSGVSSARGSENGDARSSTGGQPETRPNVSGGRFERNLPPLSECTTIVIGGWAEEVQREAIEEVLRVAKLQMSGVISQWAPSPRGKIGQITCSSPSTM